MNGVIVADKPLDWTSHDVVARVKRRLKARKVGHLGTLDPRATGVLPLVINGATKFARFLDGGPKGYEAELKLGVETDTLDSEGRVTGTQDTDLVKREDILDAFKSFKGRIKQVPPMFSSVKLRGTPLYKLARKGIVVERADKEVEIFDLEITDISVPYVRFRVSCSKGTYIRTLASDIGRLIGCGAHLSCLRRTSSGKFKIDEALSPEAPMESLRDGLIPLEDALARVAPGFRPIPVDDETAERLTDGPRSGGLQLRGFFPFLAHREMVRFMHKDELLALAEYKGAEGGTPEKERSLFSVKFAFSGVRLGA
jgi:tRNA pseudouridine55 synthase